MKVTGINNRHLYSTITIFIVLLFNFFFYPSESQGVELWNDKLISTLVLFADELGYALDKEQLKTDLNYLDSSKTFKKQFYPNILKAIRKQGVFLNAFSVNYQDIAKLEKDKQPFIAFLRNKNFCCVVEKITVGPPGYEFHCLMPDGKSIVMKEKDFISQLEGDILTKPLVGIKAKRLPYAQGNNKFVVVYFYHSGEDFESLRRVLDELRLEAQQRNKEFIYIDELGLIPEETIQSNMKTNNYGEREAFENVKKILQDDVNKLEKGITIIGESNPFYRELYKYLAQYRVKSFMEDLRYERWREIVTFDSLGYYGKAINYFFFNNIDKYLESIERFIEGYWEYNVRKRDEDFRNQIKGIIAKYPNSIIFTIRGIGHYGLEEVLLIENLEIETLLLGEGTFEDNMLDSQIYYVFLTNGVVMKEDERRLMLLKTYLEDTLRAYFTREGLKIPEATRLVCKIVKHLKEEDILKFSQAIYFSVIKQPEKLNDMWQFTYNWMKSQGFIK